MSTVTVFYCGTCSNSYDFIEGELIATLAQNHDGREFVDWIICDGPGSGAHKADVGKVLKGQTFAPGKGSKDFPHPQPTPPKVTTRTIVGTEDWDSKNMDLHLKWSKPGEYSRQDGMTKGSGWEENVAHTIAWLKGKPTHNVNSTNIRKGFGFDPATLAKKKDPPSKGLQGVTPQTLQMQMVKILRKPFDTVNAIGWSRGAVTCHMLANAIAADKDLKHLKVNIFAVDPVPGSLNWQKHRTHLPSNVEKYFGIYARDERTYIAGMDAFCPLVPVFPSSHRPQFFKLLMMPGVHATIVGDPYEHRSHLGAAGLIVRHLAEEYLSDWGSSLSKRLRLTRRSLLQLYDTVIRLDSDYLALRGKKGEKTVKRPVTVGGSWSSQSWDTVSEFQADQTEGIFVNWHHRMLFENEYQLVHLSLWHGQFKSPVYRKQLDRLAVECPQLYQRLKATKNA